MLGKVLTTSWQLIESNVNKSVLTNFLLPGRQNIMA